MRAIPVLVLSALGLCPAVSFAQQWAELMADPNTNFYEVQEAFNAHWAGQPYQRSKGYKVFKRWEWWMEPRVYPTGQRPDPAVFQRAVKDVRSMERLQGTKSNANWQPMGPTSWINWDSGYNPGNGRVNCVAVDPSDPSIIYAGTPAGGLWKSTNDGQAWDPIFTDMPSMGVSGIAIDPTNPQIVYCATGDGDGADTYSMGVIKSLDGGGSWATTGLNWQTSAARTTRALRMHPTDPLILFCASSNGLWRTEDGGANWEEVAPGSFHDVEFKPDDPGIVYACGDEFFRSLDGGFNFSPVDGLPAANEVNRMRIAVSPQDAFTVYVLCGREDDGGFLGLYASTDGGSNFTLRSDVPNIFGYEDDGSDSGGQSWYDMALAADPADANTVWIGGVNVWKSENGGVDWGIRSHWFYTGAQAYTHADVHSIDALNGQLYCGTDGGLYRSLNGGDDWTDLSNGLQITQFYRLGSSPTDPGLVIAGAQDNGMNLMTDGDWSHVLGADGMEGAIDPVDALTMYGASQNGGLNRSDDGGQSFNGITSGILEDGAWVTPFVIDQLDHNILLAGFNNLWRSTDRGDNWAQWSTFNTDEHVRAIAIAPSNDAVVYFCNDSWMRRTLNAGSSWQTASADLPANAISSIAVDPTDPSQVFVSLSGSAEGQKVYESTDAGDSWTNISGNLPNVPANTLIYQTGSDDGLYVGTDLGVFYTDNTLSNWQPFSQGLPKVTVTELEIQYGVGKLRASTFGRGLWETDLFVPESAPPTASFSFTDPNICAGDAITFFDSSLGAAPGWSWSFPGGSPGSSTDPTPQVTYATAGNYTATLTVSNPFGQDDYTLPVPVVILANRIDIALEFDDYPAETTWFVSDDDTGEDVASGGPYEGLAGGSTTEHFCLEAGCYTFTINDSYGDGICCSFGNGSYLVTNPELGTVASGGNFDFSESTSFCVTQSVPVHEVEGVPDIMDVRPLDNEGTYLLSLENSAGAIGLTIRDALGRLVMDRTSIAAPLYEVVELGAHSSGVYIARIEQGSGVWTARLLRP